MCGRLCVCVCCLNSIAITLTGKAEELAAAITDHDNASIPAGQKVVRVYQYEVLKGAQDPLKAEANLLPAHQRRRVQQ